MTGSGAHHESFARDEPVRAASNSRYQALISRFKAKTGCPVLVNTSFNVRGEPIVCTPDDAFRCFMGAGIEVLVCGNCWLDKSAQNRRWPKTTRTSSSWTERAAIRSPSRASCPNSSCPGLTRAS